MKIATQLWGMNEVDSIGGTNWKVEKVQKYQNLLAAFECLVFLPPPFLSKEQLKGVLGSMKDSSNTMFG